MKMGKRFVAFFWFVSWTTISAGIRINVWPTNIEVHIPFGFIKVGWEHYDPNVIVMNEYEVERRCFNLITWIHGKIG